MDDLEEVAADWNNNSNIQASERLKGDCLSPPEYSTGGAKGQAPAPKDQNETRRRKDAKAQSESKRSLTVACLQARKPRRFSPGMKRAALAALAHSPLPLPIAKNTDLW
jgi:hypothetical protein